MNFIKKANVIEDPRNGRRHSIEISVHWVKREFIDIKRTARLFQCDSANALLARH